MNESLKYALLRGRNYKTTYMTCASLTLQCPYNLDPAGVYLAAIKIKMALLDYIIIICNKNLPQVNATYLNWNKFSHF